MTLRLPPILDPDDVAALSHATLEYLRGNLGGGELPAALSLALVEQTLRFLPVAKRCAAARERRGETIAEVAKELKVPQYRLKDIESGQLTAVDSAVLEQYISFLGLRRWFSRWANANQDAPAPVGKLASRGKHRAVEQRDAADEVPDGQRRRGPRS